MAASYRRSLLTPYRHHLPIGCREGMTRQASTIPTTDSMAEAKVAMIRTTIMVMEIMGSMVATMISKTGTRRTGGAEIPMLAPLIKTKPPFPVPGIPDNSSLKGHLIEATTPESRSCRLPGRVFPETAIIVIAV